MLMLAAAWLAQGAEWARAGTTRELWVRGAALGADASAIERALDDPDWVARAAALEALRRAALVGGLAHGFPAARVLALARARGAPEQSQAWAALAGRAAALELAQVAEDKGLREDYIIPSMSEWEVFPREAVAVGLKAIEQGVARVKLSRQELMKMAEDKIGRARKQTHALMKAGFIKKAPAPLK